MVINKLFTSRSEKAHPLTYDAALAALRNVKFPGMSRDIISFGFVQDLKVDPAAGSIALQLSISSERPELAEEIRKNTDAALRSVPGVKTVAIELSRPTPPSQPRHDHAQATRAAIAGAAQILAVASGKGGVGKSTISTNLAYALADRGLRVGLLDADIHGPNVPALLELREPHAISADQLLLPVHHLGVEIVSLALISMGDTPVIWRGPMVAKMVTEFLHRVAWPELDVLVVDLPPGTGDVQLSLVQQADLTGALIVTTPQELSLLDARKGLRMFQQVDTPVLGIIENMSHYVCSSCGHEEYLFGRDGGVRVALELTIPLLGRIPLDVRVQGNHGSPCVRSFPDSPAAAAFRDIAASVERLLGRPAAASPANS
ncbi:MAG: Mrp/NBP35 family ATP-binding protein [Candidatus Schekmanbacteria bacterium]|nr:Mrp/NBP35 family ATP-binding protein [Candidatus Schekmanbacteria bacterium]